MSRRVIIARKLPGRFSYAPHAPIPLASILLLGVIATAMRLYGLSIPFSTDYDEGVYWQTLRAMQAGHTLYEQIFYSQPPLFLMSIYPFYSMAGGTIFAARFGTAALSLLGCGGAYFMGRELAGRAGGIAALILVVFSASYLKASQTLQADGPATAMLFVVFGVALAWWRQPAGVRGLLFAMGCGGTLTIGVFIKLLDVTVIIPVFLIVGAIIIRAKSAKNNHKLQIITIISAIIFSIVLTTLLIILPYVKILPELVKQVVVFHIDASRVFDTNRSDNVYILQQFLILNRPLCVAGAVGSFLASWRGDRRLPIAGAWLLATGFLLLRQTPLFPHHVIVLLPPLIAVAVIGLPAPEAQGAAAWQTRTTGWRRFQKWQAFLAVSLIMIAALSGFREEHRYYNRQHAFAATDEARLDRRLMIDLDAISQPGQRIITDDQFVAALADRDTPPWLVDTSMVRIQSGYLTTKELCGSASDPRVRAVLFIAHRLDTAAGFKNCVQREFHLLRTYGPAAELWTH